MKSKSVKSNNPFKSVIQTIYDIVKEQGDREVGLVNGIGTVLNVELELKD
jgi:hypothetical protein